MSKKHYMPFSANFPQINALPTPDFGLTNKILTKNRVFT